MELAQGNLETFASTLLELARQDSDLLVVTSDSRGSAKLASFAKAAPGQIVEVATQFSFRHWKGKLNGASRMRSLNGFKRWKALFQFK
jgi:hypothetical protein